MSCLEFNGLNAIERAYEAFQQGKIQNTGIMIHYVIKEVDEGEPIVTKELTFKEGETLDEVEGRIHKLGKSSPTSTKWPAYNSYQNGKQSSKVQR